MDTFMLFLIVAVLSMNGLMLYWISKELSSIGIYLDAINRAIRNPYDSHPVLSSTLYASPSASPSPSPEPTEEDE